MRPTGLESIRAVQSALAEVVALEVTSAFTQDVAQILQMLLESLAAEWDTAAEHLRDDNEQLVQLLDESRDAMKSTLPGNESFPSVVSQIEQRLSEEDVGSISLSALSARNNALRQTLEQTLMTLEDTFDRPEFALVEPTRGEIYAHLREVATRGWSFWDVSSFRGRMAAIPSVRRRDDAPHAGAVE